MTDKLIKDRICSGVRNSTLKSPLLNKKNLDLAKAVDEICAEIMRQLNNKLLCNVENMSAVSQSVQVLD